MIEVLREIGETLRRHRLRTGLTALSVAWGIFMLVLLQGAGQGLQNGAEYRFRDDAVNSVWVWPGSTSMPWRGMPVGRSVSLDTDDHAQVARKRDVEHTSGRFSVPAQVVRRGTKTGTKTGSFDVQAVYPAHKELERTQMIAGRFLDDLDLKERRKVAVIGAGVRDALFAGLDPVGQSLLIGNAPYTVVGLFEDAGGEGEERKIYTPITTAQATFGGGRRVNQIMFTVAGTDAKRSARVMDEVRGDLGARHRINPGDRRALRVWSTLEEYTKIQDIFGWIRRFTWIVGLGTVLAGLVGVSNIMLVSVAERTREFGVRKAVGATPASIVGHVVAEAVVLTSASGYAGLVAGVGLLELVARFVPDNEYFTHPEVDLKVVLLAAAMLVVAGTLAGFVPARRAARVNPVVALREGSAT